jgi:hypothetical protein
MLLLLLLYRTILEHQTPAEITKNSFVAAKLAIVILSFVAFGILCELLVFILRLAKIRLIMKEGKERRARVEGQCQL